MEYEFLILELNKNYLDIIHAAHVYFSDLRFFQGVHAGLSVSIPKDKSDDFEREYKRMFDDILSRSED